MAGAPEQPAVQAQAQAQAPATAESEFGGVSVELKDIVQEFPKPDGEGILRVVDGVDLSLDKPGINMLLGPSGCGKSTLLRIMGGVRLFDIKTPTSGQVFIDGKLCDDAHDDVVMVFQRYANRPDLSIRDNVAFPFRMKLWAKKVSKSEQKQRVDDMLEAVGLADKAKLRPSQISGGQNQRVALARALVLRPRILLMDEPFGALDAQTREEMQHLLVDLYKKQQCLVVFVTHDVTEALLLGDRVIVLSTQPAKIADDFAIREPRPRSALWQRSTEASQMQNRILEQLHGGATRSEVRVSV